MNTDKEVTIMPLSLSASSSGARKKHNSKEDNSEKITEKVEGGIIVRRKNGRKVEPW